MDRTHPDSGHPESPGIVPGLQAEIERLRAELDALKAAPVPSVPDGYQLVPVKPTDEMLRAAQKAWLGDPLRTTSSMWAAMLAAAPEPGDKDE